MAKRRTRESGPETPARKRPEPVKCPFCLEVDETAHFINLQWFCSRCLRFFMDRQYQDGDRFVTYNEVKARIGAGSPVSEGVEA